MTIADIVADASPPRRAMPMGLALAVKAGVASVRLPFVVWLYLLTVVIPIGFYAGPLLLTTLRVLLIVMIVPLAVRLVSGRFGPILLPDVLFGLHLAWATAALVVNNPDQVLQQTGSVGAEFIGGYLMGRAYIRTPEAFAALCRALVLIVCFTLPFALHETQTGRAIVIEYLHRIPGLASVAVVSIEGRLGLERVQAVFAHPIHYGLFCSVAFSLAFVALKDITPPVRRYLTSAIVAGCGLLALSSGALLAIALQIGLIAWAAMFAKIRVRWWLLVGLLVLIYLTIALISTRPPVRVFMSYATFSPHTAFWRGIIFEWGMKSVWGHPLFGIGLDDWVRPHFMPSSSVDNFWLLTAMRYGIPAFLLLALGYAVAVARVMRRDFGGNATLRQFRLAWVFTFVGLSFTLCTVHIWTNVYSFVFFMLGAGMWFVTVPAGPGAGDGTGAAAGRGAAGRLSRRAEPPVPRSGGAERPAVLAGAAVVAPPAGRRPAPPSAPGPAGAYSRFPAARRRGAPLPPDR